MPNQHCFLCASDEGLLLDITEDNRKIFHEQLETCLLNSKESTTQSLMKKLCYKCVYELDQCNSFVQKYKRTCRARIQRTRLQKYCSLCLEPAKKGYIFDLSKDNNSLHNPFHKIQKALDNNFEVPTEESKLICLNCRYTLDILVDLKSVFQETKTKLKNLTDEEIDYLKFPKTKTTIVSRKTTTTESASLKLDYSLDSDEDFDIMARGRTRITKLNNNKRLTRPKLRVCNKCHNSVENGIDMYRFHRTGLTVCKSCWITMDPSTRNVKKRTRQSSAETKLCSVFLKDVLTDAAFKEQNVYRVEQDNEGNNVYIITDESSESDTKSQRGSPKTSKAGYNSTDSDTVRQGQKRSARSTKMDSTDSEDKPNKKLKSDEKETKLDSKESALRKNTILQRSNDLPVISAKRKLRKGNAAHNSDSDISTQRTLRGNNTVTTRRAKTSVSSVSDVELEQKRNRKKLRTILRGIATSRAIHISDESSSNDDGVSKRKRYRVASASPTLTKADNNKKENVQRTRSSSISGNETTSSRKSAARSQKRSKVSFVSSSETSRKSQSEGEPDKSSSDDKKEYVCGECGNSYKNKLEGMTHKLTHFKQPELKLSKVSFDDTANETEITSKSQTVDEHNEEQSIIINVEDDEEDAIVDVEGDSDIREDVLTNLSVQNSEDTEPTEKETENIVKTQPESEECDRDQETTVTDSVASKSQAKEDKDKESDIAEAEPPLQEEETCFNESIDKKNNDSSGLIRNTRTDSSDSCKEDKDNYTLVDDENASLEDINCPNLSNEKLKKQSENVEEAEMQDEKEEGTVQTEVEEEIVQKEKQEESVQKDEEIVQVENEDEEEQTEKESEEQQKKNETEEELKETTTSEVETDITRMEDQDQSKADDKPDGSIPDSDELDVSKKEGSPNRLDEKDVESETDIKIADTSSSENNLDKDLPPCLDVVNVCEKDGSDETEKEIVNSSQDDVITDSPKVSKTVEENDVEEVEKDVTTSTTDSIKVIGSDLEEDLPQKEKSTKDSETVATEVLQEVFDLATAEVQKRHDNNEIEDDDNGDAETLENICREIHNSSDMPSLN